MIFYRPPVTSAQCIIGTEKYPDSAVIDLQWWWLFSRMGSDVFGALTKNDILKPYISDHDFRSSNDGDDIG